MSSSSREGRVSRYLEGRSKRCFDVAVCLLLLPPAVVLMGAAALMILVREGRPILFVQNRVGKNGVLFRMPKLRTLRTAIEPDASCAPYDVSSYVTPTGHVLRTHKLDELPQLFTVLTGRMSLVGPRPELPEIVAAYSPFQKQRLRITPGLTGLWQVMANDQVPIHRHLKYDLYYLRHASLWLDVKLLVRTFPLLVRPAQREGS
jgi:lipopolysaccharide/colanic/teichoic acid biosynthesis glycosyltransferase